MNSPSHYAKAVIGAIITALAHAQQAVGEGYVAEEIIGTVVAFLVAGLAIFVVPNSDAVTDSRS